MKAKIESESISVKEYERAVVFRLGRLLTGGARGPGVFFIIPCVDIYEKIDMRTATYEIPPQEVFIFLSGSFLTRTFTFGMRGWLCGPLFSSSFSLHFGRSLAE